MADVQVFCPVCRDGVMVRDWQVRDDTPPRFRPYCVRCLANDGLKSRLLPLADFVRYGLPPEPVVVRAGRVAS